MSKVEQKEKKETDLGNTKRQVSQSKYWCFTYHMGDLEQIEKEFILQADTISFYCVAQEYGKSGNTPHLQGYIEARKKIRPSELKLSKKIHWEKRRGTKQSNINYILKENGMYVASEKVFKVKSREEYIKSIKILDEGSLYDWEKEIISIVSEDPCERSIYWYWSEKGCMGKSTFCKYLVIKHNALVLDGCAHDMKYAVMQYLEKHKRYPEIIVCDIARNVNIRKLDYTGYENVKGGLFFSGKYESGMCVGNNPHFFVFSNSEPIIDDTFMSRDRWKVKKLD